MPHAIIEYSANLSGAFASGIIVDHVHDAMIHSGLFAVEAIKTHAFATDDFRVGAKGRDGTFVYVCVALLSGRTPGQRTALANAILAVLQTPLAHVDQVTVEIREMDKATYLKMA